MVHFEKKSTTGVFGCEENAILAKAGPFLFKLRRQKWCDKSNKLLFCGLIIDRSNKKKEKVMN